MRRIVNFTLTELLVVIAVIAILASLLFPALSKVKGKSNQIKCSGNMKQTGIAIQMYAQDYNGWVPYGIYVSNYLYNRDIDGGIADYLKIPLYYRAGHPGYDQAPPLAICPEGGRDGTKNITKILEAGTQPNHSYGINCYMASMYTTVERMENVKNPSSRLLLGDIGTDDWFSTANTSGSGSNLGTRAGFGYKHLRKTNVVFVDGHLAFMGPYQIPINAWNSNNDLGNFYKTF